MENSNIQVDERLWKIAKRRAEFKKHLFIYFTVNLFLWGLWFLTGAKTGNGFFPWPAFVSMGWGIGVAFNFIGAYTGYKDLLTTREYQKLINQQSI